MNSPTPPRCRLYLVTPPAIEPAAFAETLKAALDAGDVGALQLRLKGAGDDAIKRAVEALLPVAADRGVTFILNDRPDLARAGGCDGVHVAGGGLWPSGRGGSHVDRRDVGRIDRAAGWPGCRRLDRL